MNKLFPSRLGTAILLYMLCALAASAALYFALQNLAGNIIDRHFSTSSVSEAHTDAEIASFQEFVTENNLSTRDIDQVQSWVTGEKYVLMNIYKDSYLIYSSSAPSFINTSRSWMREMTPPWRHLYDLTFADGPVRVDFIWLASSSYFDLATVCSLTAAFACFTLVFLLLLKRKISYINLLANELKLLEGGDLNRAVTVKGSDELAYLANGIDEMRKSFVERMNSEKEAYLANSELITSISHDLRTPLTILIGFLDIVACGKCTTREQLDRYLQNSREKAYQIKELTDKLFEYFLAYGTANRAPELTGFDSRTLLTRLLAEQVLSLEDQGFPVCVQTQAPSARIAVNLIAVRRVFDNIFGNIKKYADPAFPVEISFPDSGGQLCVLISNTAEREPPAGERTGIGLKICEKIMAQHGGSFAAERDGELFRARTCFPIRHNSEGP